MERRIPWLWLGLIAACALVAVLAWQNRQLREQRAWHLERLSEPYLGMYVPEIAVAAVDGQAATLGAPAADYQVLYFFTPECPYCLRSAPTVAATARRLHEELPGRVEMLGVCHCPPEEAQAYAAAHSFDFPVVSLTDRRALSLFRARNVPLLIAVGRDGRVYHSELGTFDTKEQVQDLMAALRRTDAPTAVATIEE